VDVRWHSVRATVQRVSSAAVYWVRAGSDISRVTVQWMCAGSQTTNRHELNKIKRCKIVGNVCRLHSRGLALCMSCGHA